MKLGLVPDVGKAVVLGLLPGLLERLRSAEHVHEQNAVVLERVIAAAHVIDHLRAVFEDPVTEIKCCKHVDFGRLDSLHVGLDQADARLVFGRKAPDPVLAAPLQYPRVDIDTDRLVLLALLDPLAGRARGTAEILAEQVGRTAG